MIALQPIQSGEVGVLIVDDRGCISRASSFIRVGERFEVFAPNSFSPNGDGRNDFFTVFGSQISNIHRLEVFDRWGNQVFKTQDLQPNIENLGWDGTYKDQRLNPNVFTWSAEIEFYGGRLELYYGDLTLMR